MISSYAGRASAFEPAYLRLERSGELARRERLLSQMLDACSLCPRACGVDRKAGQTGTCQAGALARVASFGPHFGEESPLVGRAGSGTIFFAHCNLLCGYCQNWDIAHDGQGRELEPEALAAIMLSLQERGCHNINLVTPTHFAAQIVSALRAAIRAGLRLPLVYNCGGYESLEVIRLLDGVVDIYMPDCKYQDNGPAERFNPGAGDYPPVARAVIAEMHRQVGLLELDAWGVARRGLLIRHLVLPGNLAGTDRFAGWVAEQLSPGTYVNLMDQYRPCHRAVQHAELNRRPSQAELAQAVAWAREAGLTRLDR